MAYNPISIDDDDDDNVNHLNSHVHLNNFSNINYTSDRHNDAAHSLYPLTVNDTDNNDKGTITNGVESIHTTELDYGKSSTNRNSSHVLRGRDNGLSADAYNNLDLLTSKTPLAVAARKCLQHYYFDYRWQVSFPQLPESPLLYYPEEYKELLHNPAAVEIMEADIDAMSEGVLQRIPLTYYPFHAEQLHSFRSAAKEVEMNILHLEQDALQNGQLERLTWEPYEINVHLHQDDLALLDTDFDQSLLLQRDLPSLTLLQRPLYTDMGLVSQEQRHAARLARIVPHELRPFAATSSELSSATPSSSILANLPSSPMSPSNTLGVAAMRYGREHDIEDRASTTTTTTATTTNAPPSAFTHKNEESDDAEQENVWRKEVQRSFRLAKEIDRQFERFIGDLVHSKLGLSRSNNEHIAFARDLWIALFRCHSNKQQRQVWHGLCKFSSSYGEYVPKEQEQEMELDGQSLISTMSRLALTHWNTLWRPLLQRYIALLSEYTRSIADNDNDNDNNEKIENANGIRISSGAAKRKKQLRFSDIELDELYSGSFNPDLIAGKLIQRTGNEVGENKAALPIYPIEVMPIFPDKFMYAASRGPTMEMVDSGALDFLAERTEELRHVVLPGALINKDARHGPHVLVSGTNLLVADRANNMTSELVQGAALSYHTSKENTFESLLIDDFNTSSYLFQIKQRPHDKNDSESSNNANHRSSKNNDNTCNDKDKDGVRQMTTKSTTTATSTKTSTNEEEVARHVNNNETVNHNHVSGKPVRRSGNMQHLTINTDLENIEAETNTATLCTFNDGASNTDGRYCVYDRIGMKASFVKANTIRAPPATRYVIVFDEDEEDEININNNNNNNNTNNSDKNTNNSNSIVNVRSDNTYFANANEQATTLKRERSKSVTRAQDENNAVNNNIDDDDDNNNYDDIIEHESKRKRNEEETEEVYAQ